LAKASQVTKAAKAGSTELELADILLSESEKLYEKGHRKSKKRKIDDLDDATEPAAVENKASKDEDLNGASGENLETLDQDINNDVSRKKVGNPASTLVNTTHDDFTVPSSSGILFIFLMHKPHIYRINDFNGRREQPAFPIKSWKWYYCVLFYSLIYLKF